MSPEWGVAWPYLLGYFCRASLGQRLKKATGHKEAEHGTSLGSKEHTFTVHKVNGQGVSVAYTRNAVYTG